MAAEEEGVVVLVDGEGESFSVPSCILEDKYVFDHVMSRDTWNDVLSDDERQELIKLLPSDSHDDIIKDLLSGKNFKFGNPMDVIWNKMRDGGHVLDTQGKIEELRELKYTLYQQYIQHYHINLLEEILLSRRKLLYSALDNGSLDSVEGVVTTPTTTTPMTFNSNVKRKRVRSRYNKILKECADEGGVEISSDEEATPPTKEPFTENEYMKLLKDHKKRRRLKKFDSDLDTRGLTLSSIIGLNNTISGGGLKPEPRDLGMSPERTKTESKKLSSSPYEKPLSSPSPLPPPLIQHLPVETTKRWEGLFYGSGSIYEKYSDPDKIKSDKPSPIILENPLPTGQFMSFFSLIKRVFEDLADRKGDLSKVTEILLMYLESPKGSSSSWQHTRNDWAELTLSALCYLAAEVGAVSSFNPLPHFYPIIEFKDRIDHWKWLGNNRDSDIELLVLNDHWMKHLDDALVVVDYTDYTPLPSLISTTATVRLSKPHEVERFRKLVSETADNAPAIAAFIQELQRYQQPYKAFTYKVHGYESTVGPVKGAKTVMKKDQGGSRARGHALLKQERPNCVTILSLVRDACSRMPNGEGTRLDLCILLRDSQFIADNVTDGQLNNAVSGALDRLHYEKDPCVRYISSKKIWLYLHRNRTEEEFEHISWATEAAIKNRKVIVSRARSSPKVMLRDMSGQLIDLSPPSIQSLSDHQPSNKRSSGGGTLKALHKTSPKVSRGMGRGGKAIKPHPHKEPISKVPLQPSIKPVGGPSLNDCVIPAESDLPFLPTSIHHNEFLHMPDSDDMSSPSDKSHHHHHHPPNLIKVFQGGGASWISSPDSTHSDTD